MGIALFILCFACVCGMWYFTGRNSIYNKLLKDYCDILRIAIEQEKLLKKAKEKEVENGR